MAQTYQMKHNPQGTIYSLLTVESDGQMTMTFHGTDREICHEVTENADGWLCYPGGMFPGLESGKWNKTEDVVETTAFAIKREQGDTCINHAEREQSQDCESSVNDTNSTNEVAESETNTNDTNNTNEVAEPETNTNDTNNTNNEPVVVETNTNCTNNTNNHAEPEVIETNTDCTDLTDVEPVVVETNTNCTNNTNNHAEPEVIETTTNCTNYTNNEPLTNNPEPLTVNHDCRPRRQRKPRKPRAERQEPITVNHEPLTVNRQPSGTMKAIGMVAAATVALFVIYETGLLIPLGLIGLATGGILK